MNQQKKSRGDRSDAVLVRNIDPMHWFMPYLYPNRTDNEAFINEELDLTALNAFLAKKNEGLDKAHRYTVFHALATALVRTFTLRPKMNRFYKGHRLYQRDDISLGFIVKKQFKDEAHEGIAFLKFDDQTTIDSLHAKLMDVIFNCRSGKSDNSTAGMEKFTHLPRWLMRIAMKILNLLDYYGHVPKDLVKEDPNHASIFISNLGSIKLNAAYHHLTNWGTNSFFAVLGEKHLKPVFKDDGTYEMHECMGIGITLDERIADGYYYAQTIRLFKHLIAHPELLDQPACQEVEY